MISHSKKFVFVHPPKVAGNTIHNVFLPYYDVRCRVTDTRIGEMQGFRVLDLKKHEPISGILKAYPSVRKYRKISVIRNPWDRIASFYCWKLRIESNQIPFKEWFKHSIGVELRPQTHWYYFKRKLVIDDLLRFENLNVDLTKIYKQITGESLERIPKINQSGKPHYSEIYRESGELDTEMIELVAKYFKDDIKLGNYEFEIG